MKPEHAGICIHSCGSKHASHKNVQPLPPPPNGPLTSPMHRCHNVITCPFHILSQYFAILSVFQFVHLHIANRTKQHPSICWTYYSGSPMLAPQMSAFLALVVSAPTWAKYFAMLWTSIRGVWDIAYYKLMVKSSILFTPSWMSFVHMPPLPPS